MTLQLIIKGHVAKEVHFDFDQETELSFNSRQREIRRQVMTLEAAYYDDLHLTNDWQIHLLYKSRMRFLHYDLVESTTWIKRQNG